MSRPVCVRRTGRRTETAYNAQSPGKLAQHNEALDSGDRVNAALGVSRWSLTCIAKVHVLIRGDLSDMRSLDSVLHGNMQGDRTEVSSLSGRSSKSEA